MSLRLLSTVVVIVIIQTELNAGYCTGEGKCVEHFYLLVPPDPPALEFAKNLAVTRLVRAQIKNIKNRFNLRM